MMASIKSAFYRRWLRRRGVKFSADLSNIPRTALLEVEAGVAVGRSVLEFRKLRIGAESYLRGGCELHNVSIIGRFCSIANGVVLGQDKAGHPLDWVTTHPIASKVGQRCYDASVRPTVVGHDVWIGRDAMVFEGVSIGVGAVIAARAVVTRDVPPYAIVAGSPARLVRYRHPADLRELLLESKWWEYPLDVLHGLPLDEPRKLCAELFLLPSDLAVYEITQITRSGCKGLGTGSLL